MTEQQITDALRAIVDRIILEAQDAAEAGELTQFMQLAAARTASEAFVSAENFKRALVIADRRQR